MSDKAAKIATKARKIDEILKFLKEHPESHASRTVMRRFGGGDFEVGEEFLARMENRMEVADPVEVDLCYDIIK